MGVITLGLESRQQSNQYLVITEILNYHSIRRTLISIAVRNTKM